MSLILRVNGIDRSALIKPGTLRVSDELNARNTLDVTLIDSGGAARPTVGQIIEVLNGVEQFGIGPNPGSWSGSGIHIYNVAKINDWLYTPVGDADGTHNAWHVDSAGIGAWLQLDLGNGVTRAFRSVRLYKNQIAIQATFNVQYSDDGLNWTTCYSGINVTALGGFGRTITASWGNVGAHRYWRLYKSDAAAPGGIFEETQFSTEPVMVVFHGTIDSFTERNARNVANNPVLEYTLRAVDFNQLADRHLVAEVYDNQTMKQIVQDVITDHLADEAVTLDPACPDGPVIDHIPFNYHAASKVFDELSDLTGYFWNIDYDKVLRFIDRTTMTAPVVLDQNAGTDLAYSLAIDRTREQYRNQQYIRGGLTITETALVEEEKGDGVKTVFKTSLPVAKVPTIKVNGVAQTVGIRQVETGKQWYWQEESTEISQDPSGTKLTASDTWRIEYFGYFPFITAGRDQLGVNERIAVEGGSGLYEHIEDHEDITKAELGRDKSEGLLKRFGRIEIKFTFTSRVSGWRAGQLLTVSRAEHGLTGTFLLSAVTFQHFIRNEYRYVITAVAGDAVESWVAFFKRLAQAGRRIVRRPNEVVNLLRLFPESIGVSETFSSASTGTICGKVSKPGDPIAERTTVGFAKVC